MGVCKCMWVYVRVDMHEQTNKTLAYIFPKPGKIKQKKQVLQINQNHEEREKTKTRKIILKTGQSYRKI